MGWGMLKKRVIPVLLLREGRMVKGKQFTDYRDTGNPSTAVRIYSAQDADELMFVDIEGGIKSQLALLETLRAAAKECFMPLVAGGGICTLQQVRELLLAGADKVLINTAAAIDPTFVTKVAERFGSQCVIAGIDYRRTSEGAKVWIRCGTEMTDYEPVSYAQKLETLGAGEIYLNAIDRDGTMSGYDLETVKAVASAVNLPVIVGGGAGNFLHLAEALQEETKVSAVSCASLFHFGDNNPIRARSYLRNLGIPMRVLK